MVKERFCKTVHCTKKGRLDGRNNRVGRRRGMVGMALLLACLIPGRSDAQILEIISIIKAAVKKVIVATDLKVERMQTETIGLQNAQKAAENDMQQSELAGIAGWMQQQRDLFAGYYQELREVKRVITAYEEVKEMIDKQARIMTGYQQAFALLRQDKHFSIDEVGHMSAVLSGIAGESVRNLGHLSMVVTSMLTQMGDAGRLRIIDETGGDIDRNYRDLAVFCQQSFLLSMQRAKDANDVAATRALYGVQ